MDQLECLPYSVGSAQEGVCLLVRLGSYRVLLDCGLSDLSGVADRELLRSVDLVVCTHAHPDHARGLLALNRAFPQIPICASEVTAQLLPLNWLHEEAPIFCQALPWRSPIEFRDGLTVELYPAGHLPGAAAIFLSYKTPDRTYTLFYTGDFLLSNSRLVDGLPLEELRGLKPDVLIVEGSYGTARFPHRKQQENQLAERISRAMSDRQSILFPTPTLGLGQELLMLLRSHHHFTGQNLDIWVDGSVALGCDSYLEMLPHFPSSVQNFARHQPLFWDDRIRPRVCCPIPRFSRPALS
jgi:Cft2 family RNA processing exonuclease